MHGGWKDEAQRSYLTRDAARFEKAIYVLDAFKKKSTQGIATPKRDLERIENRFRQAQQFYEEK